MFKKDYVYVTFLTCPLLVNIHLDIPEISYVGLCPYFHLQ